MNLVKTIGDVELNEQKTVSEVNLEAIEKINNTNKKRMEEERAKANKGIIRSHRLKKG